MKRKFFYQLTIFCVLMFTIGCNKSNSSQNNKQQDLKNAEFLSKQQISTPQKMMTVGLIMQYFQIPADKLGEIQETISQINTIKVNPKQPNAFLSNGFLSCGGNANDWQKINRFILESKPKIRKKLNILITEKIAEDMVITKTQKPVSILYHTGQSAKTGLGFEEGRIILRAKANKLIGLRQKCLLDFTPVYKAGNPQTAKKSEQKDNYEFAFDSAAINLRMSPGSFLLLAPAQTRPDKTIGSLLFFPTEENFYKNTVTLCLITCNSINEAL